MHATRVTKIALVLVFLTGLCFADTFRVRSMALVSVDPANPNPTTVELGYNDAIGIIFPKDTLFLRGIEIEIKQPQGILEFPSSMAYGLYRLPNPLPDSNVIDYKGEQIILQALPSRLSTVIQIPLQQNHKLKTGPYSTLIPSIQNPNAGPLIIRLLPVMKGLPENIESLVFQIKVKPILSEQGGVRVKLSYPEKEKKAISVRIDESVIEKPEDLLLLQPGSHHLSIVSDFYRSEVRVFSIDPARITSIPIELKDVTPLLFLTAPENAGIFLDGLELTSNKQSFPLTEGEHVVRFLMGDYEITRSFVAEKGHDYTVSMTIDIKITETP